MNVQSIINIPLVVQGRALSASALNISDRIDVAAILCGECGKKDARLLCSQCRSINYCGRECQKAAWKTHEMFCRNHSLIPKDDEVVCKFQDSDGAVRDIKQREFKELLKSTFVSAPLFSKSALKYANKSFTGLSESLIPVVDSVALYDQGFSMGHGIVALRDIPRNGVICNFGGIATPADEWNEGNHSHRAWTYSSQGGPFTFDPSRFASLGAMINDGIPNAQLESLETPRAYTGNVQIPVDKIVRAIRDIRAGETIRVDYGWGHSIKKAPYTLDESAKRQLLEKFPSGLDVSLLNRTGLASETNISNVRSSASERLKAIEIQYVLKTPYALTFLHIKANLDPNETLTAIQELEFEAHDKDRIEVGLEEASIILETISKINQKEKEQLLEIADQISQGSFLVLCGFYNQQRSPRPSMKDLKTLGIALDDLKMKFCGTLAGSYWLCFEKEEFHKKFLDPNFKKDVESDAEAIKDLPSGLQGFYYEVRAHHIGNIRSHLQDFKN